MKFSGRCEYDVRESLRGDEYIVALALKNRTGPLEPTRRWWSSFVKAVKKACENATDVKLHQQVGELAHVGEMRSDCMNRGVAEFSEGIPKLILPAADDEGGVVDSWFLDQCRKLLSEGPGA
jgi:hypothetical protein